MVTEVDAVTALVFAVNAAFVAPAATATLVGTVAADALLERKTTAPPLGAAALRVTVPVEEAPPMTLVGLSIMEDRVIAVSPPPYPPPFPPPQPQAQMETVSRKAAAAKPYRSRKAWRSAKQRKNATRNAKHATTDSQGKIGGHDCGEG